MRRARGAKRNLLRQSITPPLRTTAFSDAASCNDGAVKEGGRMLLADLHIHSTWSDGKLSIPEIVDLFGRTGHDVIALTDHVVNSDSIIGRFTHRIGQGD